MRQCDKGVPKFCCWSWPNEPSALISDQYCRLCMSWCRNLMDNATLVIFVAHCTIWCIGVVYLHGLVDACQIRWRLRPKDCLRIPVRRQEFSFGLEYLTYEPVDKWNYEQYVYKEIFWQAQTRCARISHQWKKGTMPLTIPPLPFADVDPVIL